MAINRYRLTSKVTLPAGTFLPDDNNSGTASTAVGVGAPANFGTGSFSQGSGKWGSGAGGTTGGSTTWLAGMELLLDPAGALYTAIGGGNLTQITAVDDVGHSGLAN